MVVGFSVQNSSHYVLCQAKLQKDLSYLVVDRHFSWMVVGNLPQTMFYLDHSCSLGVYLKLIARKAKD